MHAAMRMIDANANRCREALRVMEDAARFILDRRDLCEAIKGLRHELRAVLEGAGADPLILVAWRNTPEDVGVSIKTGGEGERQDLRSVAIAAGKRAGEALRSLEECLKVVGSAAEPPAWRRCEQIRYRVYELEKQLVLALGAGITRQWKLCVLITASLCRRPWLDVARECIRAGADCVQLREPEMADGELLARTIALRGLIDRMCELEPAMARPTIIINNRLDIALLSGADGVHLGTGDLPIPAARKVCGQRLIIGASTHDLGEARSAVAAGADYCGVGAMFASSTKAREVSGPEYLEAYLGEPLVARVPHLAIGGITPANVPLLASRGARGVAVSGVVCGDEDPGRVCRELLRALTAPAGPSSALPGR